MTRTVPGVMSNTESKLQIYKAQESTVVIKWTEKLLEAAGAQLWVRKKKSICFSFQSFAYLLILSRHYFTRECFWKLVWCEAHMVTGSFLRSCLSLSRQLSLFIFADSNEGTERLESSLAEFSRSEMWVLVFSFIFCLDHCPPRHYQDPKWLEDWFRVSSKPSCVICSLLPVALLSHS